MNLLPKITLEKLLLCYDSCEYTKNRLKKLFFGRELLDALKIIELDISTSDKLWLLFRKGVLPEKVLHEAGCLFCEQAFVFLRKVGIEPEPRSIASLEAKRKWLTGEISDQDLDIAKQLAWDAATKSWCIVGSANGPAWTERAISDAATCAWLITDRDQYQCFERFIEQSAVYAANTASNLGCIKHNPKIPWDDIKNEQLEILKNVISKWAKEAEAGEN